MSILTRTVLILMLALPGALVAQETGSVAETSTITTESAEPATSTAEVTERAAVEAPTSQNSYETRGQFGSLLRRSPPELASILALEPTLLSNDAFLAGYPELSRFVKAHPEVRNHPGFYLEEFSYRVPQRGPIAEVLEPLLIISGFSLLALALSWFIRTLIEQKRWSRLSKTQSEVHNKILDRFGTTAELIEYIKTPAGTKFLESAPIPLHEPSSGPVPNAPLSRVMWSIQIGIIIAAGAIGMLVVSSGYKDDHGQGLFALGAIALAIGLGFIASAAITLFLSRRLGLWESAHRIDEPGLMK
ncbi:MAG TPA: hypothetical protein VEK79_10855 [Thermoanaerobaculia bacterium]|nr:hypothetical protein [Thermoanaerobaculia bacterium]